MPILDNILIEAHFEIDRFTIIFENEGNVELETIPNIAMVILQFILDQLNKSLN